MSKLLVVSCLSDDPSALVSMYLLKNRLDDVKKGVAAAKNAFDADEVLYLLPEGETVDGLDAEVRYAAYSPVLGNANAVAQVLAGDLPRPMIQDDFVAVYDGKEVEVIIPEAAYLTATGAKNKVVSVTKADGTVEYKEVPFGTKAAEVVDAADAKAVLIGGSKGRFVKPDALASYAISSDTDNNFVVIGKDTCMVDLIVKLTARIQEQSCGKCVLCREGSLQFKAIAGDMVIGKSKNTDAQQIKEVGELIRIGAYCPFGQNMPNVILSAMELFPEEFDDHMKRKKCALNICYKKPETYYIDPTLCKGNGDCQAVCPEDAIEGKKGYIRVIDQDLCEHCGKCVDACKNGAVKALGDGRLPKLPKKPVRIGGAEGEEAAAETKTAAKRSSASRYAAMRNKLAAAAPAAEAKPVDDATVLKVNIQENRTMENLKTQICVIAGGPSGLAAANQAAENGADVILVEKASVCGGAANMGMGPLGIGTHYQREAMNDVTVEECYKMFMDYCHYMVDGRVVKRYFEQSAETIGWLEDKGVEFEGAFRYFPQSKPTWHIVKTGNRIGPRAAGVMNKKLYENALKLGVKVMLETRALKIMKEDGRVTGVLCETKDGEQFLIECKAAIVCTGGAGCNPDFIKAETGYTFRKDMFNFAIPGIVGDGLKMAWDAGADHVQVRMEHACSCGGGEEATGGVTNIFKQPNLLVNIFGQRVMNEEDMQNTTFLSNVADHQPGKNVYSIVDANIVKYYVKNGVDVTSLVASNPDVSDFYEGFDQIMNRGSNFFFMADTIEELAEKIGIDPEALKETVDRYNEYCETRDEEFFKAHRYMRPIRKAPYYACAFQPGAYGTVGGIRINENCEACDANFLPVPGLYAAGADACNLYNDSYMFLLPGNSMGWAVNSGRIAGMEAASYVQGE